MKTLNKFAAYIWGFCCGGWLFIGMVLDYAPAILVAALCGAVAYYSAAQYDAR